MRSVCIRYGCFESLAATLLMRALINSMPLALPLLVAALAIASAAHAQEKAATKEKPAAQDGPIVIEKPAAPAQPALPAVFGVKAGQVPANIVQGFPMMPLAPAMRAGSKKGPWIDFSDLVLAKIDVSDDKGAQLVALVEHMDMQDKEVQVTRMQAENRTRKVTITGADGKEKQIEQAYTVTVPITEKRTIQVPVPSGKTRPMPFPVARIKFYNLDGSPMETADATKKLQKMCPVFLVRDRQVEVKKIDEIYQRSINPECVIAVVGIGEE